VAAGGRCSGDGSDCRHAAASTGRLDDSATRRLGDDPTGRRTDTATAGADRSAGGYSVVMNSASWAALRHSTMSMTSP
jgi:hypothetical protein